MFMMQLDLAAYLPTCPACADTLDDAACVHLRAPPLMCPWGSVPHTQRRPSVWLPLPLLMPTSYAPFPRVLTAVFLHIMRSSSPDDIPSVPSQIWPIIRDILK